MKCIYQYVSYIWYILHRTFDMSIRSSFKMCSDLLYWQWFHACFSSVAQSCPTLRPHESQHATPPYPSPTPGVHPNSCPLSQWCHPAISSSVVPFSSCAQSLPASGSFPMSQLFAWGGRSTGVSASESFPPKNTQGWSPWVCRINAQLININIPKNIDNVHLQIKPIYF